MVIFHEAGFHRGEEIRSEGQIGRRGLIVGILSFLWLRGGGRIFSGGGGVPVDIQSQGVILIMGLLEVFACDVGVVQGVGDRSG